MIALAEELAALRLDTTVTPLPLDVIEHADHIRALLADTHLVECTADGVAPRRVTGHLARRAGLTSVLACVLQDGALGEILRLRPWPQHGCLTCRRQCLAEAGGLDPEPALDAGYGTGTHHRPTTAVGSDCWDNPPTTRSPCTTPEPPGQLLNDPELGFHSVIAMIFAPRAGRWEGAAWACHLGHIGPVHCSSAVLSDETPKRIHTRASRTASTGGSGICTVLGRAGLQASVNHSTDSRRHAHAAVGTPGLRRSRRLPVARVHHRAPAPSQSPPVDAAAGFRQAAPGHPSRRTTTRRPPTGTARPSTSATTRCSPPSYKRCAMEHRRTRMRFSTASRPTAA